MKTIRTILIFIVGILLTYLTYKSKYQTFFFEAVIWAILILVGLSLFIWAIFKDLKNYGIEKHFQTFSLTIISSIFIVIILSMECKINYDFKKPTLLKVYYDGDFNGVGIDFKKDGTYIFDNSAIGISDYKYGNYQINENEITIDRKQLDNVISTNKLEVREKVAIYSTGIQNEKYLFQIDEKGNVLDIETEFRVIVDNR